MTQRSDIDLSDRERRLDQAIAAYLAAEDAGHPPGRDDFLTKDPELADGLRSFFHENDRISRLAAPLREAAETISTSVADPDLTISCGFQTTVAIPLCDADRHDALAVGTFVRYLGDYELLKVIGQGGMGIVFQARQISLNRTVALKMIRDGAFATEDDRRRFQNEAESVATLDHPNIIPIFEVGEHDRHRLDVLLVGEVL